MKRLSALIALALGLSAPAQLVNGSFEDNGSFSLNGWEWTCETPSAVTMHPLIGGLWSARKEIGNVKGCWPSYLYQRIPWAVDGELYQLTGWVRSDTMGVPANAMIGFATVHSGIFAWDSSVGASGYEWSFVTINDTVHAADGDTAVVLLNPGTLGGPAYGAGWFDAIDVQPFMPESVPEVGPSLRQYLDESLVLHLSGGDGPMRNVSLLDAQGRVLHVRTQATASGATIDTRSIPAGVYIVRSSTEAGDVVVRFVRP